MMRERGWLAAETKDLIDKYEETSDDIYWTAFVDTIRHLGLSQFDLTVELRRSPKIASRIRFRSAIASPSSASKSTRTTQLRANTATAPKLQEPYRECCSSTLRVHHKTARRRCARHILPSSRLVEFTTMRDRANALRPAST